MINKYVHQWHIHGVCMTFTSFYTFPKFLCLSWVGMATVGFGPGFFIPGPDPRAKTRGPNLARLLTGFFWGLGPASVGPCGPR